MIALYFSIIWNSLLLRCCSWKIPGATRGLTSNCYVLLLSQRYKHLKFLLNIDKKGGAFCVGIIEKGARKKFFKRNFYKTVEISLC